MKKQILVIFMFLSVTVFYAQDSKFGEVSKEELEEKIYPLDSTAEATFIFRKRRRVTS